MKDENGYCKEHDTKLCGCGSAKLSESRLIDLLSAEPTNSQVYDACLFYRHDFGLLDDEKAMELRYEAKEWLRCWAKAFGA